MTTPPPGAYAMTASSDWEPINAKTLRGAKQTASRAFFVADDSVLKIAERRDGEWVLVAQKRGFDDWQPVP